MTQLLTLTYHLLLEEPQTGYSLAKNIEQRTGWKPSWGSIYPTLEKLEEQGHVTAQDTGRSTTYSLTEQGKKAAKQHQQDHSEAITKIIEQLQILNEVCEEDFSRNIDALKHMQESGEDPFLAIKQSTTGLEKELYRLWREEKLASHKTQINTILKKATTELSEL